MAINNAALQAGLQALFQSPPAGETAVASCAQAWADAMEQFALTVVPPSTTVTAASAVLESALLGLFSGPIAAIIPGMEVAFLTFATTVGGGMAPAFVATPPATPVGFSSLTNQPTTTAAAAAWSSKISLWFLTGTAVPSGGGPAVNWT